LILFAFTIVLASGFLFAQTRTTADLDKVQQTLSANQLKWQQSAIDAYRFTVRKSCFCPLSDTLPIQFMVENNQLTDSAYDCSNLNFIRAEPLCDEQPASRLNQTTDSLFQIIQNAINQKADVINVDYDQTYGYPTSIAIDFITLAADDEISYQVSDFIPQRQNPLKIELSHGIINHQWTPVSINSSAGKSVIFYSAASSIGGQRGVVRMKSASTGYQFKFQEWSNLDGWHVNERIDLVAIPDGRWNLFDHEIAVGTTNVSGTEQWKTVSFSTPFKTPPQVLLALQTANGGDAVSVRVRNITTTSMQIQLVEEDKKKFSGHVSETVGYLLIASSSPSFTIDGVDIALLSNSTPFSINHHWQSIADDYMLRLEEDHTTDQETFHVREAIHVIRMGQAYFSQMVSDNGNDNAVLRSSSSYDALIKQQRLIDTLVADTSCDSDQQCQEIAFGAKPCGGPWSYLIYSTRQTNQATLTSEVATYNDLQTLKNQKDGAVSDCSVVLPSFPVCSGNTCVPGNQQPPVSATMPQLRHFESDQALEFFIKRGLMKIPDIGANQIDFSPIPVGFSPPAATSSTDRFSTTNIQETGVDEADFLKTDGRYMYTGEPGNKQIRVLEMHSEPFRVTQQSVIELDADNTDLRGLYLLTKRSNQQPDVLAAIQSGSLPATGPVNIGFSPPGLWYYPWFWMNQITQIDLYNVTIPSQPKQTKTITIDGALLASRLIDESLYVVTRYVPSITPFADPQQPTNRIEKILQTDLSELLPTVSIQTATGTGSKQTLVETQQTFLPPLPGDFNSTDLLTISRFDLGNLDAAPKTTTIIGNSDTIYVSRDAVYLATSLYGYEKSIAILDAVQNNTVPADTVDIFIPKNTTQIHKIKLTTTQPEYSGSATIEGLLTGNDDLRRFRLSEHNAILRVVSTGQWGKMGEHRVTLLQQNPTGDLEEISHLPNSERPQPLGKPNEQIHAVRFANDRLFIVTFLQVDPLIAIDLSDTSDPKIQGELEIPGYSDYLHPINDNLLLGIGKHAVPAQGPGDGRFAWFQGIRVGLFDISSLAGPKELDTIVIGERNSQSEILYDIHAFSLLPADSQLQQPFKFTVPISVYGKTFPGLTPFNPTAPTRWSHTGLYLFEVDTNAEKPALKNIGVIKSAQNTGNIQFQDPGIGINRAVLLNDGVFYSHNQRVWSADWLTPDQAIGPQ